MTWWQAMILGMVEGLTEYLPVSSTGHLLVAQAMLGIGSGEAGAKEAADAYAICIQAGAIVAVLGLYFRRVRQVFAGFAGRDRDGLRLFANMMAGFMPAAVVGLALNDWIKAQLFGPWPVVAAWIVGGVAILAVGRWRAGGRSDDGGRSVDQLTWQLALLIGLGQCLAMWPGVSRSLVTIVFGVLVGMRLAAAVEFSFLLGVVTLGAATVYDGMKHGEVMLDHYGPLEMAVGFVAAFVSAVLAVKWMVRYLQRHGMAVFGWYRIAIGLLVGGLLLAGVMVPPGS